MQTSISGPILRCVLFHRSNPLTNSHILEQPSSALSCPGWALRPSTHPLGHSHLLQHTLSISPSQLISEPFLTSTEKADALFPTFLRPQEPWHCQWVLICSTRLHRHLCSVVLLSRLNIFLLSHQSSRGRSSETSPHWFFSDTSGITEVGNTSVLPSFPLSFYSLASGVFSWSGVFKGDRDRKPILTLWFQISLVSHVNPIKDLAPLFSGSSIDNLLSNLATWTRDAHLVNKISETHILSHILWELKSSTFSVSKFRVILLKWLWRRYI